jgi:hypothetical protein
VRQQLCIPGIKWKSNRLLAGILKKAKEFLTENSMTPIIVHTSFFFMSSERIQKFGIRWSRLWVPGFLFRSVPQWKKPPVYIPTALNGKRAWNPPWKRLSTSAKRGMANFKVPKEVHFVSAWPMTGSGKVQKFKLVENLIERKEKCRGDS